MYATNVKDLPNCSDLDSVERKLITGDNVMFCVYTFKPGAEFPSHTHPAEQITYIVKGPWYLKVGEKDELFKVDTGSVIVIEPNFRHGGKSAGVEAVCIDAWSPIRSDLMDITKVVKFGKEVK